MRFFYFIITALCLLCVSCVNRGGRETEYAAGKYHLELPKPPVMMDPAGQRDYICKHFWDNFDFSDSTIPARLDTGVIRQYFVSYAALLKEQPDGGVAQVTALMQEAGKNAPVLDLFSETARFVFYDPNSPFRNDLLYLPVLEAVSQSPLVDDDIRAGAAEKAQLVSRNLPGALAEDFSYLTIQNRPGSLYGIKAPYTLIFFNNPGCTMCREIREAMDGSALLTEKVRSGQLAVLALYPDEDTDLWLSYKHEIPSEWINARDPGCTVKESGLYDLKAIPSLYLLDKDKKVILKDCTEVRLIEEALR